MTKHIIKTLMEPLKQVITKMKTPAHLLDFTVQVQNR